MILHRFRSTSFVNGPLSIRPLTSNAKGRKSSFFNDYAQKLGSFIRKRSSNPDNNFFDSKVINSIKDMPLDIANKALFNNHNHSTIGCHRHDDTIKTKYFIWYKFTELIF